MSEAASPPALPAISTIQSLPGLGFVPAATPMRGWRFDFGNFDVSAVEGLSPRTCQMMVSFGGVVSTARSIAEIDFELPATLDSLEMLKALLACYIDNATRGVAPPAREPAWLGEGRTLAHLLPWVKSQAEYETRPRCQLSRKWANLLLESLSEQLAGVADDAPITFAFDGQVLRITGGAQTVASSARGEAWPKPCLVRAGTLRRFPKRIMHDPVEISWYGARLHLGSWAYPCAEEQPEAGTGEVGK